LIFAQDARSLFQQNDAAVVRINVAGNDAADISGLTGIHRGLQHARNERTREDQHIAVANVAARDPINLRGLAHVFEIGPSRSTLPIAIGRRTNQLRALCSCAAAHGQAGGSCHRSTDAAAVFATISHDPGAALGLCDDLPLRLLGAAACPGWAGRLASIKGGHFRHGHRRVRIIWRIGKRWRYDRLGIVVGELPFIRLFGFLGWIAPHRVDCAETEHDRAAGNRSENDRFFGVDRPVRKSGNLGLALALPLNVFRIGHRL